MKRKEKNITREEAENRITELMEEIRDVVLEYNPEEEYFTMAMTSLGESRPINTLSFNNGYFNEESIDYVFPLDKQWSEEEEHEA